jgi:hypothetical protein
MLFSDITAYLDYIASVIEEWKIWRIGAMTVTIENRSTHRQNCRKAILSTRNSTWTGIRLGRKPGLIGDRAGTTA